MQPTPQGVGGRRNEEQAPEGRKKIPPQTSGRWTAEGGRPYMQSDPSLRWHPHFSTAILRKNPLPCDM